MKKEEQIRMLLHPEQYTDEQLDQMLDEVDVPVPDAGEEWNKIQTPPLAPPLEGRGTRRWLRVAASFIGVLMLSGLKNVNFDKIEEIVRNGIAGK